MGGSRAHRRRSSRGSAWPPSPCGRRWCRTGWQTASASGAAAVASARLQRTPEQQHVVRLAALALCRAHATCNAQTCCEELLPQTAYRHAAEVELLEGGLGGGVAGLKLRGRRPVSWYAPSCTACNSTASLAFLGITPISWHTATHSHAAERPAASPHLAERGEHAGLFPVVQRAYTFKCNERSRKNNLFFVYRDKSPA